MPRQKDDTPLSQSSKAAGGLLRETVRSFPVLFIAFLGVIFGFTKLICTTDDRTRAVMSVLVGILSIGVFAKNKSYSEAILTLFLGLLTVFTITWDHTTTAIFTSVFLGFLLIFFFISSVSIASKKETIMVDAANFTKTDKGEISQRELSKISSTRTKHGQLGPIERAEVVRFLCFIKVPKQEMVHAMNHVEKIKVVFRLPLTEALELYRSLYWVSKVAYGETITLYSVGLFFDAASSTHLTPSEFIKIFDATKAGVIRYKLPFDTYLQKIIDLSMKGYDDDEIIAEIKAAKQ